MTLLTSKEKEEIIKRRGYKSAKTRKKHRIDNLIIHHIDSNPSNNDPKNLKVLTREEHKKLHNRLGY